MESTMRGWIVVCAMVGCAFGCAEEERVASVEPEPRTEAAPDETPEPVEAPDGADDEAAQPEALRAPLPSEGSPTAVSPGAAPVEPAAVEPPLTEEQQAEVLRDVVRRVVRMPRERDLQRRARERGLRFMNITWEDTGRYMGSSVGPNISDLTLEVHQRRGRRTRTSLLPVLRFPNFSDRTADIPSEALYVKVGNEREGAETRIVRVSEVLADLRSFLSDPEGFRAENDDLTAPRDTHYLVSAQHVFVPVPPGMRVDFAPVLFNYQSNPGSPAVLVLLATREGTSIQIIENREDPTLPDGWGQRLYYNAAGQRSVLTAERRSDVVARVDRDQGSADDALALQEAADMVMIIQVPLRIPMVPRRAPMSAPFGGGGGAMDGLSSGGGGGGSDVEAVVIGHGLEEGPFHEIRRRRIRRDTRFPVRITIQFYKATSNGIVDDSDLDLARAQIERVYSDADFVGSLVVGSQNRPTAHHVQ
jgi:hypothetical protein